MRTLPTLSLLSILAALLSSPAAADITFDFYETGIASCFYGPCSPPPQPFVLMSITLSAGTEAGSANWDGGLSPPTVTDPRFTFFPEDGPPIVGPNFDYVPGGCVTTGNVCFYHISWDAVAGTLKYISIDYEYQNGDIPNFGDSGGFVGSDDTLAGCGETMGCSVSGFWQAAPEPGSLLLLLTALLLLAVVRRVQICTRKPMGKHPSSTGFDKRIA